MTRADRARFVATSARRPRRRTRPGHRRRTDPRTRTARSGSPCAARRRARCACPSRSSLGTDLADLGAIAAGQPQDPNCPPAFTPRACAGPAPPAAPLVTADPPPADALASAGLLRWELELPPGGSTTIELRIRAGRRGSRPSRGSRGDEPARRRHGPTATTHGSRHSSRTSIDDLQALLLRDPAHPADTHLAAGAPWRCGHGPGRGTCGRAHDAAARHRARGGHAAHPRPHPAPGAGAAIRACSRARAGTRAPICRRAARARRPPCCSPCVLAEARRWGLPGTGRPRNCSRPPSAVCAGCARPSGDGTYLRRSRTRAARCAARPRPTPTGPRCSAPISSTRTADPGPPSCGSGPRRCATAFREDFWIDDRGGGRPAAARTPDGRPCRTCGASRRPSPRHRPAGRGRLGPRAARQGADRTARPAARQPGHGLRLGTAQPGRRRRRDTTRSATGAVPCGSRRPRSPSRAWPPPDTRRRRVRCCAACWRRPRPSGTGCRRCTRGSSAREGGAPLPASGGLPAVGHRRGRRGPAARPRSPASAPTPRRARSRSRPVRGAPLGEIRPDGAAGRGCPLLRTGQPSRRRHGGGGRRGTAAGSVTSYDMSRRGAIWSGP